MPRQNKIDIDVQRFKEIVAKSSTYKDVFTALGYKESGNIYKILKMAFRKHNVNTSHLIGQGWSRGKTRQTDERVERNNIRKEWPFEKIFCANSSYKGKNQYLIKRLIRMGIKQYKCEECGISEWRGNPITLHLDHMNGNNTDNRIENLRILCPNCHSQTPTFSIGMRLAALDQLEGVATLRR